MKRRIIKLLAGFFIVMICCTIIARAADSFTIARIQTGHVKKGRLTVKIEGGGTVQMKDQAFQSLPEGQKVKKIMVPIGEQVRVGDSLVELDLDYLQERMDEQRQIVEKLKLQIQQQTLEGQQGTRLPETAQAELALQSAERTWNMAQAASSQATEAYDTHESTGTEHMAEEEYQSWKMEQERLGTELEAAWQAEQAAAEAYAQASDSYNLAVLQEGIAQEAESKKRQIAEVALQSLQVDMEAAQKKQQKLQEVMDSKGRVVAKADGVFTSIEAKEGTVTTGSEQMILSTGGLEAIGILPQDAVGKVAVGDTVKVTIEGYAKPIELVIERIGQSANKDNEDNIVKHVWHAPLDKKDVKASTDLTYQISRNSAEEYDKMVPLSAIRSTQGEDYVLTIQVKGGILGDARTAVKVPVTILAKDGEHAAVDPSAALDREDLFIVSSNKYVEAGDRVRLIE